MQYKGFLLAHNQPLHEAKALKEDPVALAAAHEFWRNAITWGDGIGYRRRSSALDAKPFLVAMAKAFYTSALAPPTAGLSNSLKADPVAGLVKATFEQAAWASFKVWTPLPIRTVQHMLPVASNAVC